MVLNVSWLTELSNVLTYYLLLINKTTSCACKLKFFLPWLVNLDFFKLFWKQWVGRAMWSQTFYWDVFFFGRNLPLNNSSVNKFDILECFPHFTSNAGNVSMRLLHLKQGVVSGWLRVTVTPNYPRHWRTCINFCSDCRALATYSQLDKLTKNRKIARKRSQWNSL